MFLLGRKSNLDNANGGPLISGLFDLVERYQILIFMTTLKAPFTNQKSFDIFSILSILCKRAILSKVNWANIGIKKLSWNWAETEKNEPKV